MGDSSAPIAAHSKPVRLAAAALHAAIEGNWQRATRAVERLNAECPGPGLYTALLAWCDTFAAHAHGGTPEFGRVRLVPWNAASGALGGDVPPGAQWAIELIQARAAGDLDAFSALIKRLNDIPDGYERGRYVSDLLVSIAGTISGLPRGYARMGQGSTGGDDRG